MDITLISKTKEIEKDRYKLHIIGDDESIQKILILVAQLIADDANSRITYVEMK